MVKDSRSWSAAWSRRDFVRQCFGISFMGGAWGPRIALAHGAHARLGRRRRAPVISADVAHDGRIWVVGADEAGRIFLQVYAPDEQIWMPRRVLDGVDEALEAGGQSRPKIALGPEGVVVLAWTRPGAQPYTGDVRLIRSVDGGRHFSPPQTVHQDRQPVGHRFEALAFDGAGALHVVWIDQRDRLARTPQPPGAALYRTVSWDGGAHFQPEVRLASGTCECCRIALARGREGQLAAFWRHRFDGQVRDHAWALLAPWGEPSRVQRVSLDGWRVDACPHHGPSLAAASEGGWHAVWWGVSSGVPGVRYARLSSDGVLQGRVLIIPDPGAEHAVVAALGRQVVVVWRTFDGVATRLAWGHSTDDGAHFAWRDAVVSAGETDLPQCVVCGDQVYALMAREESIHVAPLL
jgi:hypothetical protein